MTVSRRFSCCGRIIVWCGLLFLVSGIVFGDDANRSPTEAERKAAAALSQRYAILGIDGGFHVVSVAFASTSVSDEDLANVAVFQQLETLTLLNWNVTEAGVTRIGELKQLRRLMLPADAKPEFIDKLRKALPECQIQQMPTVAVATSPPLERFAPPDRFMEVAMAVETQLELQITDAQFARLLKLEAECSQRMSKAIETAGGSRPPTAQELQTLRPAFESVQQETRQEIERILEAGQFARLLQLSLQREGVLALREKFAAAELRLSDEQGAKINRLYLEQRRERRESDTSARTPAQDAAVLAVLTPEQRKEWYKQTGAPRLDVSAFPLDITAHVVFRFLDQNGNGQLTRSEWNRRRDVRQAFSDAGIDNSGSMPHDTFCNHYMRLFMPN